jgi:hypothetical protein
MEIAEGEPVVGSLRRPKTRWTDHRLDVNGLNPTQIIEGRK